MIGRDGMIDGSVRVGSMGIVLYQVGCLLVLVLCFVVLSIGEACDEACNC